MVFSEPAFVFYFLPFFLGLYWLVPSACKNLILITASLFFYSFGDESYTSLLVISAIFNFLVGLGAKNKLVLLFGIVGNIGALVYFKYWNFFGLGSYSIALPIGISFFTFQAVSYLVDVYRGDCEVEKSPLRFGVYLTMFPQLVAGPIVRYREISTQIRRRVYNYEDGTIRFFVGLSKKVLLADPLGLVADQIFELSPDQLSPELCWLGAISYSLQIYFDFSGYSDMAIGIGQLLGFKFPENFNYPYSAKSVTDFWRRWHMTLSTWFRDYLYIPLGGNRVGTARLYVNLFSVFALTGLWHGASLNFVVWGLYHGLFLVIEKTKFLKLKNRILSHSYLIAMLIIGWVIFRCETLDQTVDFLGFMLLLSEGDASALHPLSRYFGFYHYSLLFIAGICSLPLLKVSKPLVVALSILSIIAVGSSNYSPFIYFRF